MLGESLESRSPEVDEPGAADSAGIDLGEGHDDGGEIVGSTGYRLLFVDHYDLRYLEPEPSELDRELGAIIRNLDQAAAYGAEAYVLFSRSFEDLLTYDFEVGGVGNLGAVAFPQGGLYRARAEMYRAYLRRVIEEADRRGVTVIMHTNQFEYPQEVLALLPTLTTPDGTVCPESEAGWAAYRGKLSEFFALFPRLEGLQLTADEAEISALACGSGSPDERVNRLVEETVSVAADHGRTAQIRAWGRIEELGAWEPSGPSDPLLRPNAWLSVKNTEGDFHLFGPQSLLVSSEAPRLIVEFDAWREYSGWNFYPCYIGDTVAERIRAIRPDGERAVSVRLNWVANANPLFDKPYGNLVNLRVIASLAADPQRQPDEILRQWLAQTYPSGSVEAAFDLYKHSARFHRQMLSMGTSATTDHTRLFRSHEREDAFERALEVLTRLQGQGLLTEPENFDQRRSVLDNALADARRDISALGDGTPARWLDDLDHGAQVLWYVAQGTTDQLELTYHRVRLSEGDGARSIGDLATDVSARAAAWEEWDAESYELMRGYAAPLMLQALVAEYSLGAAAGGAAEETEGGSAP